MRPTIVTSYVSKICDVPPLVAAAALDDIVQVTPRIVGPTWELRLRPADANGTPGVLAAGWGLRAAIAVEIECWSSQRVMLGLRHRTRAVPWWSDGYFAAAHDAAAVLAWWIEDWADRPLRDLVCPDVGLVTGA
jgi:hypothetical protein